MKCIHSPGKKSEIFLSTSPIATTSVVNLENSPNQQLTGELTGENSLPVKAGEL